MTKRIYMLFLSFAIFAVYSVNSYADGETDWIKSSARTSFEIENKSEYIEENKLPNALKDWGNWASYGKRNSNCDFAYNNFGEKYCYYISSIDIDVSGDELNFTQDVRILEDGYILTVGSKEVFPSKVFVNNVSKNIISKNDRPYIYLKKGVYQIKGFAKSKKAISHLFIPEDAPVVNVKKDGKSIENPIVDGSVLRFESQAATKSVNDDVNIFAYRKISDFVPMVMTLNLKLNVTGKERVEHLGKIIPDNFELLSIDSVNTSAYIQKNGELVAELKPGNAEVYIRFRQISESLEIKLESSLASSEIWVLENDESIRVIQASDDMQAVQVNNTSIPNDWKKLPAYAVNVGDVVTLKTVYFTQDIKDNLYLVRKSKLAFNGDFLSIKDTISGDFKKDGRISISSPFELYSAMNDGTPVSITYDKNLDREGIEVRKGNANIVSVLRTSPNIMKFPAAGYDRNFSAVTQYLELAPGYKLFHVSGADSVSSSWIQDWNLVKLFIVFLATVCFYYVFGRNKAILAFIFFVLIHLIYPVVTYVSFILCGLTALSRGIKDEESKMYRYVLWARIITIFFLFISAFSFIVEHIRFSIYPGLDNGYNSFISIDVLWSMYLIFTFIYILYLVFTSKMKLGAKIFSILGIVFAGIILKSILLFVINGPIGAMGLSGKMGNFVSPMIETDYEATYEDRVYAPKSKSRYSSAVISSIDAVGSGIYLNKQSTGLSRLKGADINKYQSLNVTRNIAQTGVGFPEWSNHSIRIDLAGPVTPKDEFSIYLINPYLGLFLAFLRSLLFIFVIYSLIDYKKTKINIGSKGKELMKKVFVAMVLGLFIFSPKVSSAKDVEIPSKETLESLYEKINKESIPSCLPNCVSIPSGEITDKGNAVWFNISIHSNEDLVVPLPVLREDGSGYVKLNSITLNGVNASNTVKFGNSIYMQVKKGVNNVSLRYKLDENADKFVLSSTIHINYFNNKMNDFSFSEGKSSEQLFHINRLKKAVEEEKKTSALARKDIKSFYTVRRNFNFGVTWGVNTIVSRDNNKSIASTVEYPLISGENILSSDVIVQNGKVVVSFAVGETQKHINSIIPVEQVVNLESLSNDIYREEWAFDVDSIWSFDYSGIEPVIHSENVMLFKPRAGDGLSFDVFKPENVEGYVLTFDKVKYEIKSGRDVMNISLYLDVRASEAGNHDIIIPEGAKVKELKAFGREYPLTVKNNLLTIPVVQGVNNFNVKLEIDKKDGFVTSFPKFDFQAPVSNINQSIEMPDNRWVLFAKGPVQGAVVLFWSAMPAWILFAFLFSRFKVLPLGFFGWFILMLGLTQINQVSMFVIISWFFAIGLRDVFSDKIKTKKFVQIILVIFTFIFMIQIMNSVYYSLLSKYANMKVSGNGSYYTTLKWYQDLTNGTLPIPVVYTIPMWIYRVLMVIWAVWLSTSFVKWIKWGYKSFTKTFVWK